MPQVHRLGREGRKRVVAALSRELTTRPEVSFAYAFGSFLESAMTLDVDVVRRRCQEIERSLTRLKSLRTGKIRHP